MNETTQTTSRMWEVLCHLSALTAYIGVPFGHLVGPLICWLIKRGDSPTVDAHGKESLNFQLSMTLYGLIVGAVTLFLVISIIGWLLLPLVLGVIAVLALMNLIFVIIAAVKAGNGECYRYPLTIRFLA